MTRKKSTSSRKRAHRSSNLSRVIWIVWTLVTGGSVAGWMAPGLPLLGPLVQQLLGNKAVTEILNDKRVNEVIALAPDNAWNGKVGLIKKTLAEHKATSQTSSDQGGQVPSASGVQPPSAPRVTPGSPVQKSPDKIGIASYNIQVFGTSKMAKTWVVDILAQVVRRLDLVAIQEVRSKDDQVIPQFVAAVNADGSRYDYVIGPRLGRTDSKEQYVFVFDTNRIEVDRSSVGTMSDPNDVLHREPMVGRFRTRTNNPAAAFTFWMVNIHTDPDEVASEVDVLAGVFQMMQSARADEDDVILLGDLNASDRQFGRLGQVPGITWAVRNTTTNTRKNKMYDNILFSSVTTTEFTGRWGVADIQTVFGLTLEQALEVSDHFPVWAEFSIWESPAANNTARLPERSLQ